MEELSHWSPSNEGTPQGGVISPLLGNIYLHFVQDLWIKRVVAKKSKGSVLFRRYADDSVVCFERKDDAEAYLRALPARLAKFGLELAEEKSALVKFNRWEAQSSGKFTFLGFDFFWGQSRRNPNYWRVRRTTNAKKFRAGLAALKDWLRKERSTPLPDLVATLRRKPARPLELLRGHRQLGPDLDFRLLGEAAGSQVAQPAQPAQELHMGDICRRMGTLADSGPTGDREAMAPDRGTIPDPRRMTMSTNRKPIMIEVPPARIPEEPGAVIPHAGICEGGTGQPVSLP